MTARPAQSSSRTNSTWYEGFEKRPGVKKISARFQASPPITKTPSVLLELPTPSWPGATLARSSSDGQLAAHRSAYREKAQHDFETRNFNHAAFNRRKRFCNLQKETVKALKEHDDVEFWGSKGAEGFRSYLLYKHGSLLAGWRYMDVDQNGRLTFGEFTNQCRRMGYHGNLMQLWRELDTNLNGYISLGEIDSDAGKMLGEFKLALMNKYGDLLTAWQEGLDTNASGHIDVKEISACVEELGLALKPKSLFNLLRASPAGLSVTLKDFDHDAYRRFLTGDHKGHLSGKCNKEFIEDVEGIGEEVPLPATFVGKHTSGGVLKWRKELHDIDKANHKAAKDKHTAHVARLGFDNAFGFRRALIKLFGSLMSAWRVALDLDGNGRLTFGEFFIAIRRIGMHGDMQGLFKELDFEKKGYLLLKDIDSEGEASLAELRRLIVAKYGNMLLGWLKAFDRRGVGHVTEDDFVNACNDLEFPLNAKKLFRLLRPGKDRKTLSLFEFDTKAYWCLSRGDFRMILGSDIECQSPLEMSFEERRTQGFYHKIRAGWTASRTREFKKCCREANFPDRLVDTPEEFEQLCIRKYGSLMSAWRLCLDYDGNGRLTCNEFCDACRRIGYAGNLLTLWRHYDVNNNGHITLNELDKITHDNVSEFLHLLGEQFGHLDNAWKKGFGKDTHECISESEFHTACERLGYEHSAKKLFKALSPLPGRIGLTIWDIDPTCTRKRRRAEMAVIASSPRDPTKAHIISKGDLTASASTNAANKDGGAHDQLMSPSSPSGASKIKQDKEKASFMKSKWDRPEPEIIPGVSTKSTLAESMRCALRVTFGSTVAAWRQSLDSNQTGTATYPGFCRVMKECNFQSRLRDLWHELAGTEQTGALSKQPDPEARITFKDLDPAMQRVLTRAREKFVGAFGSLTKAWQAIASEQKRFEAENPDKKQNPDGPEVTGPKARVDAHWFVQVCEQSHVGIVKAESLFRLLFAYKSQRSIEKEDFETLLIGVPPEDRHSVWAECQEGKKPSTLPKPLQDRPPPEPFPKACVDKLYRDMHEKHFIVTTLEDFKHLLEIKYGSLFSAWHRAIDTDNTRTVVPLEWAKTCRELGVEASVHLWKEITNDKDDKDKQQIKFKDLDAETNDTFDELEKLLIDTYGSTKIGWRKCFELPEPQGPRVKKDKFVKQCGELGFAGDATKLFRHLRPSPDRRYILYEDLWFDKDPNDQAALYAQMIGRAENRANARTDRLRGTASTATLSLSGNDIVKEYGTIKSLQQSSLGLGSAIGNLTGSETMYSDDFIDPASYPSLLTGASGVSETADTNND